MTNQENPVVFDQARAASYDKRTDKLAPTRDALYLLMRLILSELSTNARVLCVGAGTGAEVISLAEAYPTWQFTVVEPAAAMLDVCRSRVEECGMASRCVLHAGYLDTLPESEPFDAATCLLVSHFFMEPQNRSQFFQQIAARLRPQGILISSDLTGDMSSTAYQSMRAVWKRMLEFAEFAPDDVKAFCDAHGRNAAVLPPPQVEAIITQGGFDNPVQFYQSLFIHAWYSRRK